MVKVKTFTMGSNHNILKHEILDNQINKFLSENDVEVVDVNTLHAPMQIKWAAEHGWHPLC